MTDNILLDKECIICLEPLNIDNQIQRFVDCNHYNLMHIECINKWINKNFQ